MDFSLFLTFPGILIIVGIVLLIVAIIIGIVAYKTVDKEELDDTMEDSEEYDSYVEEKMEPSYDEPVPEKELTKEDLLSNTTVISVGQEMVNENNNEHPDENIDNISVNSANVNNENNEFNPTIETKAPEVNETTVNSVQNEVVIEDIKDNDEELDLLLDEFIDQSNEEFVELSKEQPEFTPFNDEIAPVPNDIDMPDSSSIPEEPVMMNGYIDELDNEEELQPEEPIKEEVSVSEEVKPEERPIYGGAKPLENVNLHFDDDIRKPVYQERFQTMEIPILTGNELLETKEEKEEIELL